MGSEASEGALRALTETYLGASAFSALAAPPRPRLLGYENVVGVAIEEKITRGEATGKTGLKIYVRKKAPEASVLPECRVPKVFAGAPTDVEEIGEIYAQLADPTCYANPPGGCSVGHINIGTGTLGCLVRSDVGEQYILSNNHVLANSNQAQIGDHVVQPGPLDGGTHSASEHPSPTCQATDKCVAELADFEQIEFTGRPNSMDAAIAREINGGRAFDPTIRQIGRVSGTTKAARKMIVRKRGRTTLLTAGEVKSIAANIRVNYRPPPAPPLYARFDRQISIEGTPPPFSDRGDSGSLILDEERRAVGLLFAGNSIRTFANHIELVLQRFGVTVV